ncbi:MAG TPA: ribonuclease T2 [Roseiarcus sp.]|nr:ribonuclease T2 [Roseiarcus sp.]
MRPHRSSRAASLAFALSLAAGAPVHAQGLWNEIFGQPAAKPTPCVLDKCLNGGAATPVEPAPASPQPSQPSATAQAAPMVAPGAFDFYLLTLSWSPGFCDTGGEAKAPDQCSVGAGAGFVVHGLWPQNAHGYPSDCDDNPRPISRAALAMTQGVFPDEGLARYEWRKHGTCTGLSPEAFFASVKRARDSIAIPDALKAPRQEQDVAPVEIARAFIAANPGLRLEAMAVTCARGELEDVRLCLSKDLRQFVGCPDVAHRTCRSPSIAVAPVR